MTNCLLISASRKIAECFFGNLYDPNNLCHPNNIIYVKNLLYVQKTQWPTINIVFESLTFSSKRCN